MSINYTEIADRAVAYAAPSGMVLDFSKESIPKVDEILLAYYDHLAEYDGEEGKSTLWNLAVHFGIYLGETMLRVSLTDKGYDWHISDGMPILKKENNELSPITKAHKCILNGPEDSVKSFFDIGLMIAEGKLPLKSTYRAIDMETASGQCIKNVLYKDAGFYIDFVESGDEDFLILKSHDGFLQFYGVDDEFVAEMRINYPNGDFRTFSFIHPEKENALGRVTLETPYGQYTPTEREVISYAQLCTVVENYYKHPNSEDFIRSVPCVDTTEETKKYMGL